MNERLLDEKLTALIQQDSTLAPVARAFRPWLGAAPDVQLLRLNPHNLASAWGLSNTLVLDFLVHGSRVGLLDFSWNMVCPSCGEIQNDDRSLNGLTGRFSCVVCQADAEVSLDDNVEVSFAVNPAVRPSSFDAFADAESYRAGFFSAHVERSPELLAYMATIWKGFEAIEPGVTKDVVVAGRPGQSFRMVSAGIHSQFLFHISPAAVEIAGRRELTFGNQGLSPAEVTVETTNTTFSVTNQRPSPVGLMVVEADFPRLHDLMRRFPSKLLPFLTGAELLNNQKFRHLFRIPNLSPSLSLRIRSLTLLFTDLKGSTALYDSTGDIEAYTLIQEHFTLLGGIVSRHAGALIKTMGDAIMAAFSTPLDGVKAALEMHEAIQGLGTAGGPLGLKIGLHEGPALAINNQGVLDYFGQTVNLAARVQGLADEQSLWMTESVLATRGVGAQLHRQGWRGVRHTVALKGVGARTTVYELRKKESA